MPKSKKRKKIVRPRLDRSRILSQAAKNDYGTVLDQDFEKWNVETLWDATNTDKIVLSAAVANWVGAMDPMVHTLRQCSTASRFVQAFLAHYGLASTVVTVDASIHIDGVHVSSVGSTNPGKVDAKGMWNGHSILLIPKLDAVLDLTIGQDRILGSSRELYLPLYSENAGIRDAPASGEKITLALSERLGYSVTYAFHGFDPEYGRSPQGKLVMNEALRAARLNAKQSEPALASYVQPA